MDFLVHEEVVEEEVVSHYETAVVSAGVSVDAKAMFELPQPKRPFFGIHSGQEFLQGRFHSGNRQQNQGTLLVRGAVPEQQNNSQVGIVEDGSRGLENEFPSLHFQLEVLNPLNLLRVQSSHDESVDDYVSGEEEGGDEQVDLVTSNFHNYNENPGDNSRVKDSFHPGAAIPRQEAEVSDRVPRGRQDQFVRRFPVSRT